MDRCDGGVMLLGAPVNHTARQKKVEETFPGLEWFVPLV